MKKAVLSAFVLMLLSTAVVLRFVRPVKANWTWTETIYIRADGSVEPATAPISNVDNITYTLTDNIIGDIPENSSAIVVERDNITVDGAGYTLQGSRANFSKGIALSNRDNVTIKAIQIGLFQFGLYLNSSSGNRIYGNAITNNSNIYLYSSTNNNITGNKITNNWNGVGMWVSSNINTISGNDITNNEIGISLDWSSNNIFDYNSFVNNTRQVYDFNWNYPHTFPSVNFWDDGTGKGNYWSDYEERYPNATEMDSSGIWNTPYVIDENNQDNYPIVPEIPTSIILPLFMMATIATVVYIRKKKP